jgi:hypothetical protein
MPLTLVDGGHVIERRRVYTAVYFGSVRCDRTQLRMQISSEAFGMTFGLLLGDNA